MTKDRLNQLLQILKTTYDDCNNEPDVKKAQKILDEGIKKIYEIMLDCSSDGITYEQIYQNKINGVYDNCKHRE